MAGSSRGLVLAALGLSVVAVGLAAATLVRGPADDGASGDAPATDARLTRLEEQVARLAERGEREVSRPRVAVPRGDDAPDPTVTDRLAALEETVEELEQDLDETDERVEKLSGAGRPDPMKAIRNATPSPEQVAELRKLALDEKAETRPRLLAVRALARVPGGRTIEVARALRKLFEESEDERTRTSAIALLQGVVEPEFEPWLVDTLLNDRYSSTRESATDVLSHYTGSPRVREALADAAANDKNYDVRADAQNALDKLDEREQDGR